jgi:hypothetical protein
MEVDPTIICRKADVAEAAPAILGTGSSAAGMVVLQRSALVARHLREGQFTSQAAN